MRNLTLQIAFSLDLAFTSIEAIDPRLSGYLPLGGSHIIQIAIAMCLGVIITEVRSLFQHYLSGGISHFVDRPPGLKVTYRADWPTDDANEPKVHNGIDPVDPWPPAGMKDSKRK